MGNITVSVGVFPFPLHVVLPELRNGFDNFTARVCFVPELVVIWVTLRNSYKTPGVSSED